MIPIALPYFLMQKWVLCAHAAKTAYLKTCTHPFIKITPHTEPVVVEPTGPRPTTTDMVARRLIAGALGVKPRSKTQEEIENDAKKLQQAKGMIVLSEKRELERKQREERRKQFDAVWDE
jgi:isopentenyldiphosphate isomerase